MFPTLIVKGHVMIRFEWKVNFDRQVNAQHS